MAERFAFGENWRRYLDLVNDDRIAAAKASLSFMLNRDSLDGLTFLDAGCGSGLFSLAARLLGARVHAFDYDVQSVACCEELKRRYSPDDPLWTVETGSVIDESYMSSLGSFDVAYSWGVLHHTGDLWGGLELIGQRVRPQGALFIAIYNDAGGASRRWRAVKKLYNTLPRPFRWPLTTYAAVRMWTPAIISGALHGQALRLFRQPLDRGMSATRDLIDWVGGYPYEYAKPEVVVDFYHERGFHLAKLKTAVNYGINEFVFRRLPIAR